MKRIFLTLTVSASLLAASCGPASEPTDPAAAPADDPVLRLANENPTPLRGYRAINALIRERIIDDPDFEMLSYLQEPDPIRDFQGGSILPLLGGFQGRGTTMSNQSAIPGPMNMLLWFSVIDGLAGDIAKHCTDPEGLLPLKAPIKEALSTACSPEQNPHDGFARMWDLAVKHDAGPAEKEDWLRWLESADPELALTGRDARSLLVRDAILTALFSPEFLAGR